MAASLLAWQDCRVTRAIGCQAACAVCQQQDTEIMKNKQLCMCVYKYRFSQMHTPTHSQMHRNREREIIVSSVSLSDEAFTVHLDLI